MYPFYSALTHWCRKPVISHFFFFAKKKVPKQTRARGEPFAIMFQENDNSFFYEDSLMQKETSPWVTIIHGDQTCTNKTKVTVFAWEKEYKVTPTFSVLLPSFDPCKGAHRVGQKNSRLHPPFFFLTLLLMIFVRFTEILLLPIPSSLPCFVAQIKELHWNFLPYISSQ